MSFNDLERGESSQPLLRSGKADEDKAFTSIKDSVSIQIFKLQSNVQGIQRLVDKVGGAGDGPALRTSLHNLTEATRDMVKKSTDDVKNLASMPSGGQYSSRKPIQSKLSREFTSALSAFQRVQRLSAEKQRSNVESQKRRVDALIEDENGAVEEERGSVELDRVQRTEQQQVQQVTPQELEFQETLIAEREAEIREIESGIHELNDIFRDLGTIVEQQGGLVDNIESNITSVAQNTSSAADELTTAHEYQRKAGRRMVCLLLILIVVVLVILLAILS
ncbi:putative t-SNARE [Naematelia encephala]|uniref:Putative t-SNARE n=1 Tax=Naematelia encephala TaxID=71784 RepID=A0A1Y2BBN6_9TREE|nr:putative t-SNARE [Naematelia encephala]